MLALATLTVLGCQRDDRQLLIIYSPHGREMLQAFEERFERLNPGVNVEWIDMGSQEVLDRLRSERANPQADVWWGAPSPMFESAARDGLLARYRPSWGGAVGDYRNRDDYWYATYLTPEVIAFNSVAIPRDEAPRDWDEVLDARWDGHIVIRDPLASGTMRTIFGMIIQRSIRETGDTAAGFDWLRRLDAHTREYVLNPTLLYQKLARQEGILTLWDMPDIEMVRARANMPIDYVLPTSGTPLVIDAIAVVAGAPNEQLARRFVDFVGGEEGILLAAREYHRLPARDDIPADSLPDNLRRAKEAIVPEPMDWDLLQERGSEWMRHWDRHVRGRGRR